MSEQKIEIRSIKPQDYAAVVDIDEVAAGQPRPGFFKRKIELAAHKQDYLITSRVAIIEGKIVGFAMGDLYLGEFGIPEKTATIDAIGVHPDYQNRGVAKALMNDLKSTLKKAGVEKIITSVQWNDWTLLKFFASSGFKPGTSLNLTLEL